MPSGAKKRKASKKKKEKQAAPAQHHQPHSLDDGVHSHGDDDLKHHDDDDKDSDAEEISSPTSQEHPENHHQKEAEVLKFQGSREENKSSGEHREDEEATRAGTEEDRDIEIEQEFEPADDELNGQSTTMEDFEPQKDSKGGVLLQSLDENSVVQNETESKLNSDDLNSKTATFENVAPLKESGDETSMQSMEGDKEGVSQIKANFKTIGGTESKNLTVEPTMLVKESTDRDLSQSQNNESHVIDKKIVLVDNAQFDKSIQEINSFSEGVTELTNSIAVGDHHSSSVEPKYMDEVEKLKLCPGKIYGDMGVPADSNGEMKEKGVSIRERNGKMPPNCVDSGSDNQGTEAIVKKHAAEVGDKLSVSYNVSVTETANGADSSNSPSLVEHLNDSEVPKSSDSQPLIASTPRAVQRTSWMNCCGLFEVFSGSNR